MNASYIFPHVCIFRNKIAQEQDSLKVTFTAPQIIPRSHYHEEYDITILEHHM